MPIKIILKTGTNPVVSQGRSDKKSLLGGLKQFFSKLNLISYRVDIKKSGALYKSSEKGYVSTLKQRKSAINQQHQVKIQLANQGIYLDPNARRQAVNNFQMYKNNKVQELKVRLKESKNSASPTVETHKRKAIAREFLALKNEVKQFEKKHQIAVSLGRLS